MATCAYAEDYTLAEDTTLTPSGTVKSSVSYTSADSNSKVDLTITGATTTIYYLNKADDAVFDGLDTFSLSNNNAVTDESGLIRGWENSGGQISMSNNNSVVLDNNDTVSTGSNMYGGVLRSYLSDININNNGSISIQGNNYTTTATSNSNTYGGAVYITGACTYNMSNNGDVTISGNSLTSLATAHGGAVDVGQVSGHEVLSWDDNKSITISGNTAEGNQARGGALHAKSLGTISNTVGTVSFSGNKAYSSASTAFGGAVSLEGNGDIRFKDNNAVEFNNNTAQGKAYTYNDPAAGGGAIHGISGTAFHFNGNKSVTFSGNTAVNETGKAIGGAIYATSTGSVVDISGNDSVTFSGNGAKGAGKDYTYGGAIYSKGGVSINDNKTVLFEKNYEKGGDNYRLRSIYAADTSSYVNLNLSSADGGTFTVKDSIKVSGELSLNADYNGKAQTGKFVFSGTDTEKHLNEIIAANTAEGQTARTAKEAEIKDSRTYEVAGAITLHNGTLCLQDGVIIKAASLEIATGANLELAVTPSTDAYAVGLAETATGSPIAATLHNDLVLQDNSRLTLNGGALDMQGNDVTIGNGVVMHIIMDSLDNLEGSTIALFLNAGNADAITLDNVNFIFTDDEEWKSGDITYNNDGTITVSNTKVIPEPTTATLSLLALAALVARRRRR